MKIRGTDFVMFIVSDLRVAARFYRDDLHAAFAELIAKKTRFVGPLQDHGCCQHLEVHDPDGNVVILHHRADGTFGQQRPPSPA